ncbi:MAG: SctF chaperone SctG [Chlamydiae bacterium]|nr:SctF chaperone SctG [Chlamydiota bacterium]
MSDLQKYKTDFVLFLEAGFIAVNQFDEDAATKLFQAAELADGKNYLNKIGMGYLSLHKLELNKAINSFESVLKQDPQNEMAKAFLGISLSMTPNDVLKGEKLLMETVKSSDKFIKKLSQTALDFIDKFVKKEPTPLEVKKPKAKAK